MLQAEKLAVVGRLVASIVHEMRNPLSGIKMNIRIVQKRSKLTKMAQEHLNIASQQTERLEKMLNELLEYAKPVKVKFSTFDLNQLMDNILTEAQEALKRKNIKLNKYYSDEQIFIKSDPDLMTRIIENIITNAINASKMGSQLQVSIQNGEKPLITISDQGYGMTTKVRERLFEPFFTTREDGIGLGMSNVKKFVDILGGNIEIDSTEGVGTTVRLKFNLET